jgi:hypothetical protein
MQIVNLFTQELRVVCLGLPIFYQDLVKNDVPTITVDTSVDNHQEIKEG